MPANITNPPNNVGQAKPILVDTEEMSVAIGDSAPAFTTYSFRVAMDSPLYAAFNSDNGLIQLEIETFSASAVSVILGSSVGSFILELEAAGDTVFYSQGPEVLRFDGNANFNVPVILPTLTTTQRNALSAVNGMMIYNTTDTKLQAYAGAWVNLH